MKKVVVGMSGGIDSSMAAYLLKKEGYDVIGVTIKHLGSESSESDNNKTCCSLEDIMDAKSACNKIGIPHYVIEAISEFKCEVIDYFLDGYNKGITPSPCVICDEKIKIKKLIDFANRIGAEFISTGHYSDIEFDKELNGYFLKKSKDLRKDQTYMLYRLDGEVVKRMLFPLAKYEKKIVRDMAKEIGIETHDKPDSQGICFAPDGYKEFLKDNLKDNIKSGDFIYKDKIVGEHKGYQFYTIGQRRGLDLKLPNPVFIINIDVKNNRIIVGDYEELMVDEIEIINYKFSVDTNLLLDKKLIGKPRFSSNGLEGRLIKRDNNYYFKYIEKNAQNAPGQHIVLYLDDKVVGGGEIKLP